MQLAIEVFGDLDCLLAQGVEDIEPRAPHRGEPGHVDVGYNRIMIYYYVDLYYGVDMDDVLSGRVNAMGPDVPPPRKREREPEDYEMAVYKAFREAGIDCNYELMAED
jgi:hypothetical protein